MYELFLRITEFVESLGYIGIFIMTFIEGTFIPIPSEITLIPAGYLAAKGHFHLGYILFWSILGTLSGALFSYYIALHFGRILLLKYGKYFLINEQKLKKIEAFFTKHGPISAFSGRMLPGIKHFISFPAGLGRMDVKKFTLYSAFGATFWVSIIVTVGYLIGDNEHLISRYIKQINIGLITFTVLLVVFYIWKLRYSKNHDTE
ncbi:MAG: DedA family protein [Candidatus Midichloria sp.]|nr:DedA family protein [Candidatus Midichloria sp.]